MSTTLLYYFYYFYTFISMHLFASGPGKGAFLKIPSKIEVENLPQSSSITVSFKKNHSVQAPSTEPGANKKSA